jgi:tape measure domain-containing protein
MASNLNLSLIFKVIDQATGPLKGVNDRLQAMQAPVQRLSREIRRFGELSGINTLRRGIAEIGHEVGLLTLKLTALSAGVLYVFKSQFIDTAAQFENLAISLEAIEGSQEKAKATLAWITDFAVRTPLEIENVTKAYLLLKNAGIDPTSGSLQSLVDQNAKIGGSQENLIEITRQLGQSWMKNKLQMEEVNVLTERMVPVVGLLARAYGKSEKEIMAAISKGKIGRKEIATLLKQMGKESAGASEKQSKTWTGMMSTLSDTWAQVKLRIMDAGPFDWLKQRLAGLLDQLNAVLSPAGLARLTVIGEGLRRGFEKAEAGAISLWRWIDQLATRVGGFENLAIAALTGIAAVMLGPLIMGIGAVSLAVTQLTALFLANPMLLVITAIGVAVYEVYTHFDDLKKIWNQVVKDITEGIQSTIHVFAIFGDNLRANIGGAIDWVKERWERLVSLFSSGMPAITLPTVPSPPALKVPTVPNPLTPQTLPKPMGPGLIGEKVSFITVPSISGPAWPKVGQPVASPFSDRGGNKSGRGGSAAPVDIGGTLHIRIDSEGRPRVAAMKTASQNMRLDIDTGPTMVLPA